MNKSLQNSITDVPGIRVGQAQDAAALTGCTVVLVEKGAVGGVDQRGGAPGTRETDLLRPMHAVQKAHAILLSGGSAFGLEAAAGVMRFLEERKVGVNTGVVKVPIVPAAILYDLGIGDPKVRPDAAMGYQACLNASEDRPTEGNAGAGTGATAGKILGIRQATKTGIGTDRHRQHRNRGWCDRGRHRGGQSLHRCGRPNQRKDPGGSIGMGAKKEEGFVNSLEFMRSITGRNILRLASLSNTVIGVVATNARLNKDEANKVAQMAQDGLARTIRPAHTMFDGDMLFALATGEKWADVNAVGAFAVEVVAQAIVNGVKAAEAAGGLPAWRDLV